MKKCMVLLAVSALIAAQVFAAPQFTGDFSFDYKTDFDGNVTRDGEGDASHAAELSFGLESDLWDLDVKTIGESDQSVGDVKASATLKINEILNTIEVSLPVTVKLYAGNQSPSGTSVYSNPSGAEDDFSLSSSDIAGDNLPIAVSVAYEDLVSVKGGVDIIDSGYFFGTELNPVEGIAVAFNVVDQADFDDYTVTGMGMSASTDVDVAVLAGLGFDLSVSGSGYFAVDDSSKNNYFAAVTGGKDAFSLYAEYTNEQKVNNLYFGGSYEVTDEFTTSAGVAVEDLDDIAFGAWAKAAYTIADIDTYVKYGFSGNGDDASDHYVKTGLSFSF